MGNSAKSVNFPESFNSKAPLDSMKLSEAEISGLRAGAERELDFAVKMIDYVRDFSNYRKYTSTNDEVQRTSQPTSQKVTPKAMPKRPRMNEIK
jgi:hypothetical protein